MNRRLTIIAVLLLLAGNGAGLYAQTPKPQHGYVMPYIVNGQDTVYFDDIVPAVVRPKNAKMSKRQWRDYYRRVHNFSKAYPYALFVARTIQQTDSLFAADHYTARQQDKYLNKMKNDLLKEFEPIFRGLTLKQGLMMIRLIDREVGQTPYYILKRYLDTPTAGFWQGVARFFGGNLKQPYDRFGEDADLEDLVAIWQAGRFDMLYMSIFGKERPEIYIPERFR
ncbi:MAG: DUF4294 domain-containing protein [Bacteroidales bacterium]|nr:DUF4294 domain-containing protein [Bacteroidales bacterium]